MRTANWTDTVSVLDRVTAVFDAFGEHDEGLGVSELARRANLPKSTVSRIAADLVDQRLLDRDGQLLYLGVRLFELGQTVQRPRLIRQRSLPVMKELRDVTRQTVHLGMLDGADIVIVAVLRGEQAAPSPVRVGSRHPAHATALGKAMLAHSSPDAVTRILSRGLEKRTPRTICDPAALQRELVDIRALGVAVEREESITGLTCTASPVIGHGGLPRAAISVAGPAADASPERAAPAVRAAAAALSRRFTAEL